MYGRYTINILKNQ